jgi:hypothetical protein
VKCKISDEVSIRETLEPSVLRNVALSRDLRDTAQQSAQSRFHARNGVS